MDISQTECLQALELRSPWRGTALRRSSRRSSSRDRWRPRSSRTESRWGTLLEASRSGSTGGAEMLDRITVGEHLVPRMYYPTSNYSGKWFLFNLLSSFDKLLTQQGPWQRYQLMHTSASVSYIVLLEECEVANHSDPHQERGGPQQDAAHVIWGHILSGDKERHLKDSSPQCSLASSGNN